MASGEISQCVLLPDLVSFFGGGGDTDDSFAISFVSRGGV